jgi:hypothetical protein
MVLEVENQGFFDAKNRIGIKIKTLSVEIMGGQTLMPGGAYDEVNVRRPEIMAARQVEKAPDRAVFWDRVIAGAGSLPRFGDCSSTKRNENGSKCHQLIAI